MWRDWRIGVTWLPSSQSSNATLRESIFFGAAPTQAAARPFGQPATAGPWNGFSCFSLIPCPSDDVLSETFQNVPFFSPQGLICHPSLLMLSRWCQFPIYTNKTHLECDTNYIIKYMALIITIYRVIIIKILLYNAIEFSLLLFAQLQ